MKPLSKDGISLSPQHTLMVLGLAAVVLTDLFLTEGGNLADLRRDSRGPQGECVYFLVRDREPIGTVFLEGPGTLSQILSAAGVAAPSQWEGFRDNVPCQRTIRLTNSPRGAFVEKMPGAYLVCAGRPVDLNTADCSDLVAVPGIGPVLADRIVRFRDSRGAFSRVEDLLGVRGIGRKKFLRVQPYVTVGSSGDLAPQAPARPHVE